MQVRPGGNTGADIEELPYALGSQVRHRAAIQRTDRIFVTKTEPAAVAAATVPNRTG
jgi:hypothetical protein